MNNTEKWTDLKRYLERCIEDYQPSITTEWDSDPIQKEVYKIITIIYKQTLDKMKLLDDLYDF